MLQETYRQITITRDTHPIRFQKIDQTIYAIRMFAVFEDREIIDLECSNYGYLGNLIHKDSRFTHEEIEDIFQNERYEY